jgi:predicted secreted Zn-dependent protease
MAGVKPKFKIQWTKQDKKTYAVPGSTYDDVYKFFQKKNTSGEEWGKFSPERPNLSFKPSKGEPITEVTLMVGYTITMPAFSKANALGKKAKAAWDKMMKALEKHEDTHRATLEKSCNDFGSQITSKTDLSLKDLQDLFKAFPKDAKTDQDAYDNKTAHGVKEGVYLPAPDEVQD